jgi:hypothetical protein
LLSNPCCKTFFQIFEILFSTPRTTENLAPQIGACLPPGSNFINASVTAQADALFVEATVIYAGRWNMIACACHRLCEICALAL